MDKHELYSILKRILLLTLITFASFILCINIMKYTRYIININSTVNEALKNKKGNIQVINNSFNSFDDYSHLNYNPEKAHNAYDLKYKDDLRDLKNSDWDNGINILVTGSDKKDFYVSKSRADVIIIIRITPEGKVLSISIPRDTLITVYGSNNKEYLDKIGHSMYWNGLDGLKKSCETLIGSPIYKVVIIDNFRSFEAFLSIIGGVSIDKKLEGKLGVQWIRNRSFKFGDIDRCKRHQVFLKKSINKLWKITGNGNVFISTILFSSLRKIVQTDLTTEDFIKLLYIFKTNNFNPESHFYTSVLPGNFDVFDSKLLNRQNLSCWKLNENIPQRLSLLFYSDEKSNPILSQIKIGYMDFIKFDLKRWINNVKLLVNNHIVIGSKARVVKLVNTLDSDSSER